MLDAERIGKSIKVLRKRKGITQAALAEMTGISDTYMGYVENGKKSASLQVLARIAESLDITVSELIKCAESSKTENVLTFDHVVCGCSDNEKNAIISVANSMKEAIREYLS